MNYVLHNTLLLKVLRIDKCSKQALKINISEALWSDLQGSILKIYGYP